MATNESGRRNEQLPVTETAKAKLKAIGFREGDSPETKAAILREMARLITETHGQAAETVKPPVSESAPVAPQVEAPATNEAGTESPEAIALALAKYKAQYDTLPDEVKQRCTWKTLISPKRLLANNGEYLKFAMGLQNGGDLVHIDPKGNPVLRDGGTEPVMKGMSYVKAFDVIYGKDWKKGVPRHGYEMADDVAEIRAIEAHTRKPFVADENGKEYRATHLFSGKDPSFSRSADSGPGGRGVNIDDGFDPKRENNRRRGVMRLLRVLER